MFQPQFYRNAEWQSYQKSTKLSAVSSILLVDGKNGGYSPVTKLTNLNSFVDVQYFKKEGIRMLKDLQGDFIFIYFSFSDS